jgi:hypothetical protein
MPRKKPQGDPTRTYTPEACLKAMACFYCVYDPATCFQWATLLARTERDGVLQQCSKYDPKARNGMPSAAYPITEEERAGPAEVAGGL